MDHANLCIITIVLTKVVEKWTKLVNELDIIVDGKRSFLNGDDFVKDLTDGVDLERSKIYYWAIEYLLRFDASVADNIPQWRLYRESRIEGLLEGLSDSHEFVLKDREARNQCDLLRSLRLRFRRKLDTIQMLRDGVSVENLSWLSADVMG